MESKFPWKLANMDDSEVKLCTWIDFSLADIEGFLSLSGNREGLTNELRRKLGLDRDKHDAIELDMYVYAFLFGEKEEFSAAQLSTLLGIVKRVHAKCVSTVFDNQSDCIQYFQHMMVQHSIRRPPFSLCVFSPCEVKKINEYMLTTYFKHYKLYKYAFTKKVCLNLALSYAGQDSPEPDATQESELQANEENMAEKEDRESQNEEVGVEDFDVESANTHLKELINCGLSKMVQQEQDQLQAQLVAQETRLLDRISALEAVVETKRPSTSAKKKSSSKSGH